MAARRAISVASRSRWPVLRRSWKTTRRSWSTSRATSLRMDSAVFFLGQQRVRFGWTYPADLRVDLDKFLMQTLQLSEFSDLSFGLSLCGTVGQRFGNGFAINLVGEPEIGAVARIFGLMAVAVGLATPARGGCYRATTQVAE